MTLRGIHISCLALSLIALSAFGKTPPILSSGDQVWFASNHGLYRYDKIQDEWSVFSAGNGLAGSDVRDVGVDEGIIWAATDRGVNNSDVRFSDWRSYTTEDGLPGDDVRCLAFSGDYVWVGTGNGAARFDKLLEEWKSYTEADGMAGDEVNDIAVDGEVVWFATSRGVSKFEVEFDKWTSYTSKAELPSVNVTWVLIVGEHVWFVTDEGLARYDKKLRSWKSYRIADGIVSYFINNVVIDGDSIWLVTKDGVSSYDAVSDSWAAGIIYHSMLPGKNVTDLAIDGEVIWFCTDNGVSSYDAQAGSWRHYTTADGLLDNNCQGIIVSGQVLVVTEKGVNLYDKKVQEWDVYEFPYTGAVGEISREKGLRLDERGIGFDLSREAQVRLSGYSSLERTGVSRLQPERLDEYNWKSRSDLSLRGAIPGERSVVGFYDDTDEDDIEYGLTYRGRNDDLLQEAAAGEFEARMRNSELIEDTNLMGAGALLRNDGVRLNVEPRYGRQRGYFETDFFTYRTGTSIYELSHRNVIPETDEVTAGKKKLRRGADYLIVYPSGWLTFHREELLEEGERIEIRYQYEPVDEEYEDQNLAILTTGLDLGSNHYAGVDLLRTDDLDVISLNSKSENVKIGLASLKLQPEIAFSRWKSDGDTMDGIASRAELVANVPRTQFRANYERYGDDFRTVGICETRFGEMDQRLEVFSQIDVAQWMPLMVQWQRDRSGDDLVTVSEEDTRMNVILSRKPYPTLALTGERNTVTTPDQEGVENSARADFQYDLPERLLSPIRFRRAEVNGYYREARGEYMDAQDMTQTGYAKLNLYPVERFALATSFKLNRAKDKGANSSAYQLKEELQRLLVRSSFASVDGIMSTFHLDDMSFQSRAADGDLVEDKDRYLAASLNVIPGVWTKKLEMLMFAGRYSLIQQTVPLSEDGEERRRDSNARSLRLQANLRPHNTLLWTGTYEQVKSWIEGVPSVEKLSKYRSEAEFKPGSKHRVMLEYCQEHEDEADMLQKKSYSPSLWWETRLSRSWTTRLRSIYEYDRTREKGEISETGSTLTPGFSFRYTARELPYGGRLYLSQGFSVSIYRAEQAARDLASETYSTSSIAEWELTRNLSLRLRASVSYEDNRTQGEEDEASANVYIRALARF